MTTGAADRPGQLLVWTDVDPAHESEFNRWYDREHMGERVGIPGFQWARRYRAVGGARPYLALYRTQSLAVFRSADYQRAFQNQTQWSLTNFGRMRDTVRRVGTVDVEAGAGTGGALGLVHLAAPPDAAGVRAALTQALAVDGALGGHFLSPDPGLSVPLTASGPAAAPNDAMVFVEATDEQAASAAARIVAGALAGAGPSTFALLWELRA